MSKFIVFALLGLTLGCNEKPNNSTIYSNIDFASITRLEDGLLSVDCKNGFKTKSYSSEELDEEYQQNRLCEPTFLDYCIDTNSPLEIKNTVNAVIKDLGVWSSDDTRITGCTRFWKKLRFKENLRLSYYIPSNISEVFFALAPISNLHRIKSLEIYTGTVTDFELIKNLVNLEIFDAYQVENITNLSPMKELTQLKSLEIIRGSQPTETINFSDFNWPKIETISIQAFKSKLKSVINISDLESLKTLVLSGHENLSDFSGMSGATSLEILDLSESQFSNDDFLELKGMSNLNELKLQDTNLSKEINLDTFSLLPKLRKLDLSSNAIETIDFSKLLTSGKNIFINLEYNKLTSLKVIEEMLRDEENLDPNFYLYLTGNPIEKNQYDCPISTETYWIIKQFCLHYLENQKF